MSRVFSPCIPFVQTYKLRAVIFEKQIAFYWHWLEYLRIIEDIDIKDYCGGEEAIDRLNNALSESINRHCEGIKMLNALLTESQK